MKRRAFLATAAMAASGLGGCLSTASPAEDEPPETDSPTTTSTDDPTPTKHSDTPATPPDSVVVKDIVTRKAVTYQSTMGSGGVLASPDSQYVVATVRAPSELSRDLSRELFTLETDSDSWTAGLPDTRGAINWAVAGHEGGPVDGLPGRDRAYLAFEVPSPLSTANPRIRYEGAAESTPSTWPLPEAATERLAAPEPAFELDSIDVPESVSAGETLNVSLTATNVSDTDGHLLASVHWPTERIADDDESHLIERTVPAGETVTATLDLDTEYTAFESGPVTLSVEGHVTASREVELIDVS